MNREDKKITEEFERNARIVDRVNYIMMKEILSVLKDIRKVSNKMSTQEVNEKVDVRINDRKEVE